MTQANSEKGNSECSYQESNLRLPDRNTWNFFFRVYLCHSLNNTSFSFHHYYYDVLLFCKNLNILSKLSFFSSEGSLDMNTTNCFAYGYSKLNCSITTAVDNVFAVLAIAVNLLSCPLVVLLNALIITAVRKKRRLQTAHNILLASMAGTDLVVGIFSQPVFIAREIFRMSGGSASMYYKLLQMIFSAAPCLCLVSVLHLTLIAVERYLAMKYSLQYDSIVTKFRITVAAACCWLISIVHRVLRRVIPDLPVIIPQILVILNLPVNIFCHVSVYFVCRRHLMQIRSEQVPSEATRKFVEDRKAWKTTTVIIGGMVLSFLPGILRTFGSRLFEHSSLLGRLLVSVNPLTFSCVLLNSLLNPIIYCMRSQVIRETVLELLKKENN